MTEKERSWCKMKWFQEALQNEHEKSERKAFLCGILERLEPEQQKKIITSYSYLFRILECVFCRMADFRDDNEDDYNLRICKYCVFNDSTFTCYEEGKRLYETLMSINYCEMGEGDGKERSHE